MGIVAADGPEGRQAPNLPDADVVPGDDELAGERMQREGVNVTAAAGQSLASAAVARLPTLQPLPAVWERGCGEEAFAARQEGQMTDDAFVRLEFEPLLSVAFIKAAHEAQRVGRHQQVAAGLSGELLEIIVRQFQDRCTVIRVDEA